MKPALAISAIVVSVLATVVVEETRIKKLQDEITQLRALPPAAEAAPTPPVVIEGDDQDPTAETPDEPATQPAVPGIRQVPEDYPDPDVERVREIALSPYSQLHYTLNLTNRERAYFEDLMASRQLEIQQLAGQWIDALPDDRAITEQSIAQVTKLTDDRVRKFLGDDADFETYATYEAMRPGRELYSQIAPVMDQQGVVLEVEKELKLIEAIHTARKTAGGIDWNSLEGLQAIATGGALERFKEEWAKQGELLTAEVGSFLDETEAKAFLAAREQIAGAQIENLESAIDAVR